MNKNVFFLYKYSLYKSFSTILPYLAMTVQFIFCVSNYFILNKFFLRTDSTDLHYFFSCIPYIQIIILPLFLITNSDMVYTELSILKKIILQYSILLTQLLIISFPLIAVPISVSFFTSISVGQVFTGFLLLIFYYAASCAASIFFYTVFENKAVSFILSVLFMAVSNSIHLFLPFFVSSSTVKKIIQSVSFLWHFNSASRGIADTRDFFYYTGLSSFFIIFAIKFSILKAGKRESLHEKKTFLWTIIVLSLLMLNSTRYYLYSDMTKFKTFNISDYTKQILNQAQADILITYYRSPTLNALYPQTRDIYDYLIEFSKEKNISVKLENADKKEVSALLANSGIPARQIQTSGTNRTEFTNVYSAIIIQYMDKWEVIPFTLSQDGLEFDIAEKLGKLILDKKRTVDILCANGMSLEKDYGYIKLWLNTQGFDVRELFLDNDKIINQNGNSQLIMVLGSSKLSLNQTIQIEKRVLNGDNVLFAVSPYNIDIEGSWNVSKSENTYLIELLEHYGFGFSQSLIADLSCSKITLESYENSDISTTRKQVNYPLWINLLPQKNAVSGMTLFWPVMTSELSENVKPLLYTSNMAWQIEENYTNSEELFVTNPFEFSDSLNKNTAIRTQYNAALFLDGKINGFYTEKTRNDAKIIVIPDQYYINSLMLGYIGGEFGDYRNLDFTISSLFSLNGEEELAELHRKKAMPKANLLSKIADDNHFIKLKNNVLVINYIFIPILIFAIYIVFKIYKKAKIKALLEEFTC